VTKVDPTESVGVVCVVNGTTIKVGEYSEISKKAAEKRDDEDPTRLAFRAGNIANHYFTLDFLHEVCARELPFHVARKKIPYVDENGVAQTPTQTNGVKMEQFVFDVFAYSSNFHLWEVSREDEFAPLKNGDSTGVDCPATCVRALHALHAKWLIAAGAKLQSSNDANDNHTDAAAEYMVEIDPSVSYAGEQLDAYCGRTLILPAFIDTQL